MALDVKLWTARVQIAKVEEPGKPTRVHVALSSDQPFVARSVIAELDSLTGKVTKFDQDLREPEVYLPFLTCLAKVLDSVFEESGRNFSDRLAEDLHGTKNPEPEKGGWSH